jgi:hypothetical protein
MVINMSNSRNIVVGVLGGKPVVDVVSGASADESVGKFVEANPGIEVVATKDVNALERDAMMYYGASVNTHKYFATVYKNGENGFDCNFTLSKSVSDSASLTLTSRLGLTKNNIIGGHPIPVQ